MDQARTAGDDEPAKRIAGGGADAVAAAGGCFDCNICLECAAEPVVTLCGHLYCWPCIYEWLRPDDAAAGSGSGSSARRRCPVCKATVSPDALVPLYGRGGSSRAKKPPRGLAGSIPRRPALRQSARDSNNGGAGGGHYRNVETDAPQQAAHHADALLPPLFADRGMMHSTAGGVLGGMAVAVLPWVLRGQAPPPGMFYSSTYHLMNPRQRRRHMEVERSLHQIWFFLFVFVLLCLLLF
ncbi:unnamed protein product [Urochloa humidicola]